MMWFWNSFNPSMIQAYLSWSFCLCCIIKNFKKFSFERRQFCSNVWDLNLCLQRRKEYINHVYPLCMIQKLMIQTVWFYFCFLAPGCTRSATPYTLEMIHELCMHVQALLSLNAWLKIQFGLERGVMHFQLLLSREWWWWSLEIVFRMPQKCRVHTF